MRIARKVSEARGLEPLASLPTTSHAPPAMEPGAPIARRDLLRAGVAGGTVLTLEMGRLGGLAFAGVGVRSADLFDAAVPTSS